MQNMQNIDLAVLFCILFCILLHVYVKKYANAFFHMQYMQKNMQTLNPICKILQGLYSTYSAYICTAQFADVAVVAQWSELVLYKREIASSGSSGVLLP